MINNKAFELRPAIPESAYKPVKRCSSCQSVYLSETKCEACGRSLLYHPIGEPFGAKSHYGFKERYLETLPLIVKYFPIFENKNSKEAKSYTRQLTKRFDDLLEALGKVDAIASNNRRMFYIEMMELMDELLRYGVSPGLLHKKIEGNSLEAGVLLTQELLIYLGESKVTNQPGESWQLVILNHRYFGIRVSLALKIIIITATVLTVAVNYYHFISLQVGK